MAQIWNFKNNDLINIKDIEAGNDLFIVDVGNGSVRINNASHNASYKFIVNGGINGTSVVAGNITSSGNLLGNVLGLGGGTIDTSAGVMATLFKSSPVHGEDLSIKFTGEDSVGSIRNSFIGFSPETSDDSSYFWLGDSIDGSSNGLTITNNGILTTTTRLEVSANSSYSRRSIDSQSVFLSDVFYVSGNSSNYNVEISNSLDAGTEAVTKFSSSKISGQIGTRPLFAWYNYTTNVAEISSSGTWDFKGNSLNGVGGLTISSLSGATGSILGESSGLVGTITVGTGLDLTSGTLTTDITWPAANTVLVSNGSDFQAASGLTWNSTLFNIQTSLDNTYAADIDWSTNTNDTIRIYNTWDDGLNDTYSSIYMRANGNGDFSSRIINRNISSGTGEFIIQTRDGGSVGNNFTSEAFKIESGSSSSNVVIPNGDLTVTGDLSVGANTGIVNIGDAVEIHERSNALLIAAKSDVQIIADKNATTNSATFSVAFNTEPSLGLNTTDVNFEVLEDGNVNIFNGDLVHAENKRYTAGNNSYIELVSDTVGVDDMLLSSPNDIIFQIDNNASNSGDSFLFYADGGVGTPALGTLLFQIEDVGDVTIPAGDLILSATGSTIVTDYTVTANANGTGVGVIVGSAGSGQVALSINDGGGNAQITFNHTDETPDKNGNSFRMSGNVDSTTTPEFEFELAANTTASVIPTMLVGLVIGTTYLDVPQQIRHKDDVDTYMEFDAVNSWKLIVGGSDKFSANSTAAILYYSGSTKLTTTSAGITVTGDGTATDWVSTSDLHLKQDLEPINFSGIYNINGYYHGWKENPKQKSYGVIAQEVEQEFPELVTENDEGIKHVSYQKMVPILIETIKDLKREIEEIKKKL